MRTYKTRAHEVRRCMDLIYDLTHKKEFVGSITHHLVNNFGVTRSISIATVLFLKELGILINKSGNENIKPIYLWNDEKTPPNDILAQRIEEFRLERGREYQKKYSNKIKSDPVYKKHQERDNDEESNHVHQYNIMNDIKTKSDLYNVSVCLFLQHFGYDNVLSCIYDNQRRGLLSAKQSFDLRSAIREGCLRDHILEQIQSVSACVNQTGLRAISPQRMVDELRRLGYEVTAKKVTIEEL